MQKRFTIDGFDIPITLARRKGTRSLRLSVKSDGTVRVTVPYGVPELMARRFVQSKRQWIVDNHRAPAALYNGHRIGNHHHIVIEYAAISAPRSRVTDTEVKITLPHGMTEQEAQNTILRACERALKKEAERLLPQRLEALSIRTGLPYRSCTIKKMKSRWGACDAHNNIMLNSYLMQLDWSLIDYVLIHELAHTKHHHHQSPFWELVERHCPDYKALRKRLKEKPTAIQPSTFMN